MCEHHWVIITRASDAHEFRICGHCGKRQRSRDPALPWRVDSTDILKIALEWDDLDDENQ